MTASSQKKIVFVLVAVLYLAGLAGGLVPESTCTCGMEQASGGQLKCYCCAREAADHCPTISFKACHRLPKSKGIAEPEALIEAPMQSARAAIPSVSFRDTTAHTMTGFDNLPERPPAV